MALDIVTLRNQLNIYASSCGEESPYSILDFLFYWYSAAAPVDDGRILQSETALAPVFEALPMELSDRLFDRISDLCLSYQRAAFLEGLHVGFSLEEELNRQESS